MKQNSYSVEKYAPIEQETVPLQQIFQITISLTKIITTMSIGMIIGGVEAIAGVVTMNPAMIVDGGRRVATSYVIGEALEPVKDIVGDAVSDIIDAVN